MSVTGNILIQKKKTTRRWVKSDSMEMPIDVKNKITKIPSLKTRLPKVTNMLSIKKLSFYILLVSEKFLYL